MYYCLTVNCTDGEYPNPNLCGVGVVQKFIEAYYDRFRFYENKGWTDYQKQTCIDAKDWLWLLSQIEYKTVEEKERKQEVIKMYRYMYRNSHGMKPLRCTFRYFFPVVRNTLHRYGIENGR